MADAGLLARLFETPVAVERAEVAPPPTTRHIAVRTGKRYGKTSLTARHGREPLARHRRMPLSARGNAGPEGTARAAAQVGLVTHKDCERAMAEALGIPEHRSGHFWGMRGSNRLEDCTILFVVGTPAALPGPRRAAGTGVLSR